MATTGADIYRFLKDGIDQGYSGYLNTSKANRLLRETVAEVVEQNYRSPESQKQNDQLSSLIVLDEVIEVRGNRVYTVPLRVSALTVVGTTATITIYSNHQLLTGDTFSLKNLTGFTPAITGDYTVASVISTVSFTFTVAATTGTWNSETGQLTHAFMFENMMHPLTMQSTFVDPSRNEVSSVNPGTAMVTFLWATAIRSGDKIRIENALGVTGLNADFYAEVRSRQGSVLYLYSDPNLLVPVTSLSGTYQGGGIAKIIVDEYMTKLFPDRRIAPSSDSDAWHPKYGTNDNGFNIYPNNQVCTSIKADYIKNPEVEIDTLDAKLDLELYYPYKFLMHIKDRAVTTWMIRMREEETAQISNAQDNTNI